MDVNISPVGAQTLRPEGSISDRLDVDGQSFEMFLNISETLGNPVIDPGPQRADRPRSASNDRRDQQDDSYALDRREDSSREERIAQTSTDERDEERPQRDPAQEMAELMSPSVARREDSRKESTEITDTPRIDKEMRGTSGSGEQRDSLSKDTTGEDNPNADVRVDMNAQMQAVDAEEQLSIQQQPDGDESSIDPDTLLKTVDLKELTNGSKGSAQDNKVEITDHSEAIDDLSKQSQEDALAMDNLMEPEVEDWQLLQPKSQEAKKVSGTTTKTNGQMDPLIDTMTDFSPDDSRFLDEPMTESIDGKLQDMNGEFEFEQKQPNAQQKGAEAEWSRLLREGMMAGERAEKVSQGKSELGKLAGLSKTSSTSATIGPRTGLGSVAPIQSTSKPTIASETKQTSMPTKGSLPEGVDELSILRQVSDGLRLKAGRTQRAEIRLNPQELGTVQIKMEMSGDSVKLVVSAEHSGVGDLLNNGLDQLKKDLLAQGLHIEEVEIRNELTDQRDQDGQADGGRDDEQESERKDISDGPVTRHHSGRLNVRA